MRRLIGLCGFFILVVFTLAAQQGCSSLSLLGKPVSNQIVTSPNDSRQYRHITLANQLDVLLISDPSSDKAAASLDVYIGSYQNPQDRAGLVHFLEHMLFLGTSKYPDPGEYQRFISEHGGSHNAGTGLEHTNYFFDIDAAYLEPALDRFAQFFSSPNFDAKYVDRERNAVESEYRLKIKDDGRRLQDVLQEQVNPKHPLSKFTVGNLETLANWENRPVRDELLAIYKRYYSANIMKLVVLGSESLDELQAIVEPRFAVVENSDVVVDVHSAPLFEPERLPMMISAVPLQNSRELSLSFPMPKMLPHWQKKPASYLAALIGHEGEGSLLDVLKKRGWAEALSAGVPLEDRGSALFSVNISITPKGLENQQQIAEMFFAWVALIREQGIESWRYSERAQLSNIAFRFQEKQNPVSYVSSLSSMMQSYPVNDVLQANFVMTDFDAELVAEIGALLTPDNLILQVTAPEVQADQISLMYQTPYAVADIPTDQLDKWRAPQAFAELSLPPNNPYIPSDLELLAETREIPQLLIQSEGITAWHFPDTRFGVPKAHIIAAFETTTMDSPEMAAAVQLYLAYIEDLLGASIYPAREAGLDFSLRPTTKGFSLVIGGYSDRQLALLEDILGALENPQWEQARFDRIQQTMFRELNNFRREYPFRQVVASLYSMIKGQWTALQKASAVNQLTMPELAGMVEGLSANLQLKVLISGNHSQQSAEAVVASLSSWTELKALQPSQSVVKLLPVSQKAYSAQIPVDHNDAALMLYVQGRNDSLRERAHMLLIGEMLSAPFYTSLRTEKQLGYVVAAFANNHIRVPGLALLAQSSSVDEDALRSEFEQFLKTYVDEVRGLDQADLNRYKTSVLSNLQETPKNLAELNSRFMESVGLGYTDFDFRDQLAEEVSKVTMTSLNNAYRAVILTDIRALSVETVAPDKNNTAVDLRKQSKVYQYDF
jgi:insulysin